MSDANSILVLTSCTATKASAAAAGSMRADELYTGQQHRRLMAGVTAYRDAGEPAGRLDLHILSAGHGLVRADEQLSSYDASFTGMRREQLHRRARRLGVPQAIAEALASPRRLTLLLLGDDYLQAAELSPELTLGATTVAFTSRRRATRLPPLANLHVVPLDNEDARRFSCGLIGLKGELARRLLLRLGQNPEGWRPLERGSLLVWLEQGACIEESQAAA